MNAMTPAQCRAARGLLDWVQGDLSAAAEVGLQTVRNFENGRGVQHRSTMKAIIGALETAGVEFIPPDAKRGPGVRLRK